MKSNFIISIISFLISLNCYPGEMETNVIIALMSYDKPRIYTQNIKKELNERIGRNTVIFFTSTYQATKYNKIEIPIRVNDTNYVVDLNKNSIHIFYKREF